MSDWFETYNYYDGVLSGLIFRGGRYEYFVLQNGSPLYPTENEPYGRKYVVWYLSEEPTAEQLSDIWWYPERPPDSTITEDELADLPERDTL